LKYSDLEALVLRGSLLYHAWISKCSLCIDERKNEFVRETLSIDDETSDYPTTLICIIGDSQQWVLQMICQIFRLVCASYSIRSKFTIKSIIPTWWKNKMISRKWTSQKN